MARAKVVRVKDTGKLYKIAPAAPPFKPRDRKKGHKYTAKKAPPTA